MRSAGGKMIIHNNINLTITEKIKKQRLILKGGKFDT
jgi:hypothetical protein